MPVEMSGKNHLRPLSEFQVGRLSSALHVTYSFYNKYIVFASRVVHVWIRGKNGRITMSHCELLKKKTHTS